MTLEGMKARIEECMAIRNSPAWDTMTDAQRSRIRCRHSFASKRLRELMGEPASVRRSAYIHIETPEQVAEIVRRPAVRRLLMKLDDPHDILADDERTRYANTPEYRTTGFASGRFVEWQQPHLQFDEECDIEHLFYWGSKFTELPSSHYSRNTPLL